MIRNLPKHSLQIQKGYTIEFKIKTDDSEKSFYPYFVNEKGYGFKAYITSNEIGLFNAYKKKLPILQQMEKQEEKVSSIIMMDKHIFIVLP